MDFPPSAAWDAKEELPYLPVGGVSFLYSREEGNRNVPIAKETKGLSS